MWLLSEALLVSSSLWGAISAMPGKPVACTERRLLRNDNFSFCGMLNYWEMGVSVHFSVLGCLSNVGLLPKMEERRCGTCATWAGQAPEVKLPRNCRHVPTEGAGLLLGSAFCQRCRLNVFARSKIWRCFFLLMVFDWFGDSSILASVVCGISWVLVKFWFQVRELQKT